MDCLADCYLCSCMESLYFATSPWCPRCRVSVLQSTVINNGTSDRQTDRRPGGLVVGQGTDRQTNKSSNTFGEYRDEPKNRE